MYPYNCDWGDCAALKQHNFPFRGKHNSDEVSCFVMLWTCQLYWPQLLQSTSLSSGFVCLYAILIAMGARSKWLSGLCTGPWLSRLSISALSFFSPLLQFVLLFLITQGQCHYNSPVACGDPCTATCPVTLLPRPISSLAFFFFFPGSNFNNVGILTDLFFHF